MSGATVALGPWGSQSGGGGGQNMLQMMGDVMKLRETGQQWNSRQEAGQILSGSKTIEEALEKMQRSPNAAWMLPAMNEARSLQSLHLDVQQKQMGLANSGRDAVIKGVITAGGDPDQLIPAAQSYFGGLAPDTQRLAKPGLDVVLQGLTAGLDKLPDAAARRAEYSKRLADLAVRTGMKPEEAYQGIAGTPYLSPQIARVPTATGAEQSRVVGGPQQLGGALGVPPPTTVAPTPGAGAMAPGVLGEGPGKTQQEYLTHRGTDMAVYQKGLDDSVSAGMNLMSTLQEGRDALKNIQAGGGASFYEGAARFAQAIGVPSETVNKIANGNLAATQEFMKLAPSMAMSQLRQQIPTGSRLNQNEWKTFEGANPNINMDPNAIDKIFNFWTRIHVRDRIEQQQLGGYLDQGGDISKWPVEWAKKAQNMGLVGPAFKSKGGKEITPVDINTLLDNPDKAAAFDKHYGTGSAASFLNLQGGR